MSAHASPANRSPHSKHVRTNNNKHGEEGEKQRQLPITETRTVHWGHACDCQSLALSSVTF